MLTFPSGPNIMIPALVVSWGLVTTFQGFINNYAGLLAARFFLGLTEGAILPVCLQRCTLQRDMAKPSGWCMGHPVALVVHHQPIDLSANAVRARSHTFPPFTAAPTSASVSPSFSLPRRLRVPFRACWPRLWCRWRAWAGSAAGLGSSSCTSSPRLVFDVPNHSVREYGQGAADTA